MTDRVWTRRAAIRSTAAAGALAGLGAGAGSAANVAKPNILFILADDMGYADASCYGRPDYKTPNIDRLAAEGMRFNQAYANSAVCSATRTALITGRYQDRLAIGLEEPLGRRDVGLPPSHPTLPSLLRQRGYGTTLVGKWHLGEPPRFGPLKSGYDHFWGFRGGALDYFSHELGGKPDLWDDDTLISKPGYLTDLIGDQSVKSIEGYVAEGKPFFISVHFNAPHWPWEAPDGEATSKRLAGGNLSPGAFASIGGSQKAYAGMVTRLDAQIGRLLQTLERLDRRDDTLVIFTSDNGGERYSDTWPFTGRKTELLEGGLRIPALVRWPGHVAPGAVSEQVIISMDWEPTLLAIAGASPDPAYAPDGVDLGPTLLQGAAPYPRTLCWRYLNLSQQACREGDWKYLKILGNTYLFNVVEDPLERTNRKDDLPELYQRLLASYKAWNAQMLPLDPAANTSGFTAKELADHFGINTSRTIDPD